MPIAPSIAVMAASAPVLTLIADRFEPNTSADESTKSVLIDSVWLAPDPTWLYVLVGMDDYASPTVRGFRIRNGEITEVHLEFEENQT